ncbi:hypothetical protein F503_01536 [Ophiostoma piceae UAMH 11346]|uniref:Uncharacterized protein n=1 Tax=Ophiostoma piceae (strain UAMH 11346) TaxID=1262450 RepID=S3CRF2_OPHP1|nr:hypothetical protein F503_01536 [Ophiostoma piceae UAMH 11346]
MQEAPAKRQPKKLTKSRNSSESVPVSAQAPTPERPKPTPSVLQKKNPKRQASISVPETSDSSPSGSVGASHDDADEAHDAQRSHDYSRSASVASATSLKGKEPQAPSEP